MSMSITSNQVLAAAALEPGHGKNGHSVPRLLKTMSMPPRGPAASS
ncbi:hypothetical protein FVEN_g12846 [Fusarium venenatum]|nr:hypothetical protein FVEN_g12846 [Fusarium venenatum]